MRETFDIPETDCDLAEPYAAPLVESLRAFGYDLASAIADLVDNSIFAKAKNIWIEFSWNGEASVVSVTDDGLGMTEKELIDAMRPGSRNPLEDRDPLDLGRYGLGMKTASFSQCRRLTVSTKTAKTNAVTRCWDLDFVAARNKWLLIRQPSPPVMPTVERLGKCSHGTLVVWENMDRLVKDQDVDNETHKSFFHSRIENVEKHLAMVFHRFLEGKNPLKIFVNKQELQPWDPFLHTEKATQQLADERIKVLQNQVNVVPFVLPHASKLSPQKHEKAAGTRGWNAHQGFYVYRNKRLLVPGDWLGLPFAKEEHFKLARILLDIPNSMDQLWEIDVTKSKARPPDVLKADLRHIAEVTRKRASDVYRHRGKVVARSASQDFVFVWQQKVKHGRFSYHINREHPLVQAALASNRSLIESVLRLAEETIPIPLLAITNSENPDKHAAPFEKASPKEVLAILERVFDAMRASGQTQGLALDRLRVMEPFDRYPEIVEAFRESLTGGRR